MCSRAGHRGPRRVHLSFTEAEKNMEAVFSAQFQVRHAVLILRAVVIVFSATYHNNTG